MVCFNFLTNLIPVLYSVHANLWKLTDFGISSNATSKEAKRTVFARGTSSYQAPELLQMEATFTNKVDIWSLGCVLHILATTEYAFHEDWQVQKYYESHSILPVAIASLESSDFLQHHVAENIRDLLRRRPQERPTASTLCGLFTSYCLILDLSTVREVIQNTRYPRYNEWKQLCAKHDSAQLLLLGIAQNYGRLGGDEKIAANLLKGLVSRYVKEGCWVRRELMFNGEYSEEPEMIALWGLGKRLRDKLLYEHAIDFYNAIIERHPSRFIFTKCLADVRILMDQPGHARDIYQVATRKYPHSIWPWQGMAEANIEIDGLDAACTAIERAEPPNNPISALVLANLYAAKGDYSKAIGKYLHISLGTSMVLQTYLRSALIEYTEHFTPPGLNAEKKRKSKKYDLLLLHSDQIITGLRSLRHWTKIRNS
jgi:tetratricopeptide (TPR) repeat protein